MNTIDRRTLICGATGTAALGMLAGCLGEERDEEEPDDEVPAAERCLDDLRDAMPEDLADAESIDGIPRVPDDELYTKDEAAYQCHTFFAAPQSCSNCRYYILPPRGGDGTGACSIVEGGIRSQDWCSLWRETERR